MLKVYRKVKSFITIENFFTFKPLYFIRKNIWFLKSFMVFKKFNTNKNTQIMSIYPCLFDNSLYTPVEPSYFFQDTWAAKKIFDLKPSHHYDVGSLVKTIGIIAQYVPVTMIDIRPIELKLENLFFKKGSVLDLPFEDESIESLSSLCVIEHIGLGRYGDAIDPFGSEKAILELKRVLKMGGYLFLSVPVDKDNMVYFNAHRAFTRDYILSLFSDCVLIEEKYQYGKQLYEKYDFNKGFGTGLFMFQKTKKHGFKLL